MEARTVVFNSVLTGSWRIATAPLPLPAVRGFLRVVSPTPLAFADYKGNRQMLSTGNLAANDRVALFLMDYPHREHLKILGHARLEDNAPTSRTRRATRRSRRSIPSSSGCSSSKSSRSIGTVRNTSRRAITAAEVQEAVAPLRQRIAELEAQLKARN